MMLGSIGKFAQDYNKEVERVRQGSMITQPNYSHLGHLWHKGWVMRKSWSYPRGKATMNMGVIAARTRALRDAGTLRDNGGGTSPQQASYVIDRALAMKGSAPSLGITSYKTRGFARTWKRNVQQKLGIIPSPDLQYTQQTMEPTSIKTVDMLGFDEMTCANKPESATFAGRNGLGFMETNLLGASTGVAVAIGATALAALVGGVLWEKYKSDQAQANQLAAAHQEALGKAIQAQAQQDYGAQQTAMGQAILLEAQQAWQQSQLGNSIQNVITAAANKGVALTSNDLAKALVPIKATMASPAVPVTVILLLGAAAYLFMSRR